MQEKEYVEASGARTDMHGKENLLTEQMYDLAGLLENGVGQTAYVSVTSESANFLLFYETLSLLWQYCLERRGSVKGMCSNY